MQKIKLKQYICYRYESKLMGGKTFIFNLDNGKIYLSSYESYKILEYIDFYEPKEKELIKEFQKINIKNFLQDMINKGVLEYENRNT